MCNFAKYITITFAALTLLTLAAVFAASVARGQDNLTCSPGTTVSQIIADYDKGKFAGTEIKLYSEAEAASIILHLEVNGIADLRGQGVTTFIVAFLPEWAVIGIVKGDCIVATNHLPVELWKALVEQALTAK